MINSGTRVRYNPNGSIGSTASFTYRAWDQTSGTASTNSVASYANITSTGTTTAYSNSTGTATIAINNPPVAVNDTYSVYDDDSGAGNLTLTVPVATGVLANDTDPDPGASLSASVVVNVSKGTLNLDLNGNFTYTPNANTTGWDTFTYRVSDGTNLSNIATVTIFITGGIIPIRV